MTKKKMKPLDLEPEAAVKYQRNQLVQPRNGTGLHPKIKIMKLINKGANNSVYLAQFKNMTIVVRQPRRNSDTQRIGNASWEFRNSAIATHIGVAPLIYDAWYVRHSTKYQKSGLHLITEYFSKDVHTLLCDNPQDVIPIAKELKTQTVSHLRKMSNACLFCYDLKPANMVFNSSPIDVRFIDFGRDFCEWRPYMEQNQYIERAPVLSFIQTLVDEHLSDGTLEERTLLYKDLALAVMVIMLSANIAFTLDQSRTAIRTSFAERSILNYMASAAAELRQNTRGSHVPLIKEILRHREIKDTIRHYMGRRNCGTKRTFYYAGFRKS